MNRLLITAGAGILSLCLTSCASNISTPTPPGPYPSSTITLKIPFSPGGPTDLAARTISSCMGENLGIQVIPENKAGGGGAVGTLELVSSQPDGYTLGIGTAGAVSVAPVLSKGAGYTHEDIEPLTEIYVLESVLLVGPDSPYNTIEELLDAATAEPGTITVAVGGAATEYALELRRMKAFDDLDFVIVPFNGGSEARNALMGGNVDALFVAASQGIIQTVNNGALRALATGGEERISALPEIPTLVETGYPDLTNTSASFSLVAPEGLPEDKRELLMTTAQACLESEKVIQILGSDFIPDRYRTPDEIQERYATTAERAEEVTS